MEGDPGGKQAFRAATKRQSKMRSTRAYPRTYLDELRATGATTLLLASSQFFGVFTSDFVIHRSG